MLSQSGTNGRRGGRLASFDLELYESSNLFRHLEISVSPNMGPTTHGSESRTHTLTDYIRLMSAQSEGLIRVTSLIHALDPFDLEKVQLHRSLAPEERHQDLNLRAV